MKKKTGPVAKALNSQPEIDAFVKENEGEALIGYYNSEADAKKFFDAYTSDKAFEDFGAGYVVEPSLVQQHGAGSIQLFRPFAEPLIYKDSNPATADLEGFKEFVVSNGYPLVEEINSKNFQRFVDAGLPLAVLFTDPTKKAESASLLKSFEEVATSFKGKMSFALSDGVEYKEQLDSMGGNSGKLPELAAMDLEKRLNYPFPSDDDLNKEAISEWVSNILNGKVKPFYKSEPVPEKNDGPVTVIVGKTFESIVYDDSKDVLVEFYAPWCGHCKSLEPKYNRLGDLLKPHSSSIVIGKVDATTNDTPIPVEGFPTLFFFPKGGKAKPMQYDGARTEKGILEFLKKNAVAAKDAIANVTYQKPAVETATAEKKDEL
jgi:protein disulfide-isomerase A1